jgi:four helix bundle protein
LNGHEIGKWKFEAHKFMIALTDLDVYKLGEKLSDMIWDDYDQWPEKAQRTIGLQVIRSADSISANLAEGYGRFTAPDRKKFYRYSRGSFEETKTWLRKSIRRRLIEKDRIEQYDNIIKELGPKLNAFINATKDRS